MRYAQLPESRRWVVELAKVSKIWMVLQQTWPIPKGSEKTLNTSTKAFGKDRDELIR